MKPTSSSIIERRLARHDHRARSRRAHPVIDCFFRPQADATLGQTQRRADDSARRAFRRMTAEMLVTRDRYQSLEKMVFALVTALTAWPLVSLLIVLAETVPG